MIINSLIFDDAHNPFIKVVTHLMRDKTSHIYSCDVIIGSDALYVTSHDYDIIVKEDRGLYKVQVFDETNESVHIHYASDSISIAKIIRNIHIFNKAYTYAYMYEYLLENEYVISPVLIGCDSIHICIVDTDKYDTIASIVFSRRSDGTMMYRYGGGCGEYKVNSVHKVLYDFLEGWC